jgi:hypothetical protein
MVSSQMTLNSWVLNLPFVCSIDTTLCIGLDTQIMYLVVERLRLLTTAQSVSDPNLSGYSVTRLSQTSCSCRNYRLPISPKRPVMLHLIPFLNNTPPFPSPGSSDLDPCAVSSHYITPIPINE